MLAENLKAPKVTLRVNSTKITAEELINKLEEVSKIVKLVSDTIEAIENAKLSA